MRSRYNEHFVTEERNISSDILKYKTLRDLPCHVVLAPQALNSVERWLKFDTDAEYKSLVLAWLRSLQSVVRIQTDIPTSTVRTDYRWNTGERSKSASGHRTKIPRYSMDTSTPRTPQKPLDLKTFYTNKPDFTPAKMMKKQFLKGYGDYITQDLGCLPMPGSSSY